MPHIIEIELSEELTYQDVSQTTAYLGTKRRTQPTEQQPQGGNIYDIVATVPPDNPVLSRSWHQGIAVIDLLLRRYITARQEMGEQSTVIYTLSMGDTWPTFLVPAVNTSLRSYLSCRVTARWLLLCGMMGEAQEYEAAAEEALTALTRNLNAPYPMRRAYSLF